MAYNIANMYIANRDRAESGGGGGSDLDSRVSALELTVDGDSTASPPVVGLVDIVDKCGKYSLLWENSDPTESMAEDTEIALSSGDYDMLLCLFHRSSADTCSICSIAEKGDDLYAQAWAYEGNVFTPVFRVLSYTSATAYTAGGGFKGTNGSSDNAKAIPIKIYGIKF